eukprot:TRINITY_DN67263_c0_g1_i2.p1 TRINITY_DN67263_c0_g1~~TRINITY_DN67263_c0_g1_i2.p1  ORF type:complete len:165 (+),score=34.53 TRINITY_DN67263_c0_g1_i2:32-526(+)
MLAIEFCFCTSLSVCYFVFALSYYEFFFFFNDTATTEIYTRSIVGSVRCVQETGINAEYMGQLTLLYQLSQMSSDWLVKMMKKKISLIQKDNVELSFANKIQDSRKIDVNLLFEKFYTADRARNTGSTGLGLSIVKLLAEKINAKAVAESEEDILILKIVFQQQ